MSTAVFKQIFPRQLLDLDYNFHYKILGNTEDLSLTSDGVAKA